MRLFLAIDLPPSTQERISDLYLSEHTEVRWTPTEQLHLTLQFIGEVQADAMDKITSAMEEVTFRPFELQLSGIGHFRSGIIWLGVARSQALMQLQSSIKYHLHQQGIITERRKFTPHITIGRCKNINPILMKAIEERGLGFSNRFTAENFQLKSSRLSPLGAEYHTEMEFFPD
ncbi:RNA 2',3'-cyclic phosphodiesterase [uncultured Neptuniibacter sp.]|uniref:RNA 2',3'-cyclic phosphodiesterase n=1 Tax=uncultured Neptuniibacter sp. TaxID=502143 RepID=UPI00263282B9|nr:RNA 2',3'-cyclic phosphodiesterase [uncultured Neptuniibacter sp.]